MVSFSPVGLDVLRCVADKSARKEKSVGFPNL